MGLLSLLRRWWRRSDQPEIMHTLVCGATRSGKSEAELVRLVDLAKQGNCAIVLLDPPGTLAAKFMLHLHARQLDTRVIYDRLADTDCVPGYDWLPVSSNPDPLQRIAENDERVREFAAILLRRRAIYDPAKTPLIEEWLLAALHLYLAQDEPALLSWLGEVFDLHSSARARLLAHCTEPHLVQKFRDWSALGLYARRAETGPAERILRAVLTSPAFAIRCGKPTFDFWRHLDSNGILILDGSSHGNLSRDAASVMMGAVILKVIAHCRTGTQSKVVLVLDEAVNADLLGLHESRALAEAAKWQLECHLLIQDPFNFPSEEIRRNVLQNCWQHEWFRQGSSEAARLAAEDVAIPLLDPLHVHHREYQPRSIDVGYDRVGIVNKSVGIDSNGRMSRHTSWNTVLWPIRKEIVHSVDRYTLLQDQILLTQKTLMALPPGYRFVRDTRSRTEPEYVKRCVVVQTDRRGTDRCTPYSQRLAVVLRRIQRPPIFRTPRNLTSEENLQTTARQGAATELATRSQPDWDRSST